MFVGHYGVSFAAKPLAPRVPLWVWFTAVQSLDAVWSLLVLLGVEKLHGESRFRLVATGLCQLRPAAGVGKRDGGHGAGFLCGAGGAGRRRRAHVILSFPLELLVLGVGAWLYAETETLKHPAVFWGFVIFLAAMP